MNFKEMKPGYPIYIFDKGETRLTTGKVADVSMPHVDTKIGSAAQFVVDVTIEHEGKSTTFCMFADSDVAYQSNKVISAGRETILREVQAVKAASEAAIAQVDNNRRTIDRCKDILAELDPSIKERQETDERFSRIESSLAKLAASIEHLVE